MSNTQAHSLYPLLAGASAGMAESFITYPTECVKTVSQLSSRSGVPKSPIGVAKHIFQTQGVRGFYSGCGAVIAGNALKSGTRFYTYETLRNLLPGGAGGKPTALNNLLAGIGAGVIESIVAVTPSETIKTRLIEASQSGNNGGTLAVVGGILRTEGVLSLYRGLMPTIMKQSANSAVRFSTYEMLKRLATDLSGGTPNAPTIMLVGGLTGLVTVYATMPFDVVKTRMQQSAKATHYKSSLDCFLTSLRTEGAKVFWRGSSPRVVRLVVSGSVSFAIYEAALKALQGP